MPFSTRRLALVTALLGCWCPPLHGQGAWDAILNIDPYPSPYYSDWDVDPNIATLTIINTTTAAQQVRIHFNVTDRANKIVISGSSDAQNIGAGATVLFDNPYDVAGSTHRDEAEDEIAARTGRLREGEYTACAVVADMTGFSLAESCADFTIVYPDPPLLLGPDQGEVITQQDPLFQWTPVQVPIDFQLSYVMRIVEVLNGQTPQEALRANIPHFQSLNEQFPNLRYPIDARPFEVGKKYAWTVQVLDQNGYAAAANDGRSEIWTLRFDDEQPNANASDQSVSMVVLNSEEDDSAFSDGWDEICTSWNQVIDLDLRTVANGKWFFPQRFDVSDARLVRADTVTGTYNKRQWVIYGTDASSGDMVLMSGDCGITGENTRKRWLGRRAASDAQELASWRPEGTDETHTDALSKLQFGVRIVSWFEEELGEDALAPVKEFLEHNEGLEVKTGLNVIGIIDARQTALWNVLGRLPYADGRAEIELAGFIGANVEVEGEVSLGSEGVEAGAEAEADVLVLRAMLPEYALPYDFFKTVRVGIEYSIGASVEVEHISQPTDVGTSAGAALKLILELKDKLDNKWSGELELGGKFDREDGIEIEPTLTLKADTAWRPWDDVEFEIGHPEIEVKLTRNVSNTDSSVGTEWEAGVKGAAIFLGEEIGTLGISFGKAYDSRAEKLVELAEETLKKSKASLEKAKASGDAEEIARAERNLAKSESLVARNKNAKKLEDDAKQKSSVSQGYKQPMVGKTFFKVTLGLGDMSISKYLDLIQKIGLVMAQRKP
ncbi:MAG TPA: hypothetical protein VGD27_13545 [Longimicrobiales bacterium]